MASTKHSMLTALAPRYWPTWLGIGLLRLTVLLPYPWQMWLGRRVGDLFFLSSPNHRRIVRINLEICYPTLDDTPRKQLRKAHFMALGMGIMEIGLSWWASERRLSRLLNTQGKEHLDQAVATGHGVILLTGHFTTLEIGGRLMSLLHPTDATFRPGRDNPIDAYLRSQRHKLYQQAIPKTDVRGMIRRLREKRVIGFAPDQAFGAANRVYPTFFGRAAASNPATGRFAAITGAKVVPYHTVRRADNSGYDVIFQPALKEFPSGDAVADTRRTHAVFETQIGYAPEQYLWAHKRFKFPAPGQKEVY